jgi:hypothetical protein
MFILIAAALVMESWRMKSPQLDMNMVKLQNQYHGSAITLTQGEKGNSFVI